MQPLVALQDKTEKIAANAKDRYGDPLPAGALARLGSIRMRHAGSVRFVAFAGDIIISAGEDGWTHRWEAATGKRLASLRSPTAVARNALTNAPAALSPDGRFLGVFSETEDESDKLMFWRISGGRVDAELKGQLLLSQDSHGAPCFSADGKILAVCGPDEVVRVIETETGKELRKIALQEKDDHYSRRLALSRDGKLLATAANGAGAINIWETGLGHVTFALKSGDAKIAALSFAPDAKTLVSGTEDGVIQLWEFAAGKPRIEFKDEQRARPRSFLFLEFSPDGRFVAVGDPYNDSVLLWETATGKVARKLEDIRSPRCAAFSADSKVLATGDESGRVRVWDVESGKEDSASGSPDTAFGPIALSADGKILATRGDGVQLWSFPEGKRIRSLAKGKPVCSLAMFPKGDMMVTGGSDGRILLWDLNSGQQKLEFIAHQRKENDKEEPEPVAAVAFSPGGALLASGGSDSTVRLWNVAGPKELHAWKDRRGWIFAVAISPDGKIVAGGGCSSDSMVTCLWDVTTGKLLHELEDSPAMALAFSREGDVLVTAGGLFGGWWISFVDVKSGKTLAKSVPASLNERDEFFAAAVSPDGQTIALGSLRGIFLWDMTTRKQVRHFFGEFGACTSLAFARDGRTLLAAHADGTVLFWDVSDRATKKPR
jgi:WD40 repeat protein